MDNNNARNGNVPANGSGQGLPQAPTPLFADVARPLAQAPTPSFAAPAAQAIPTAPLSPLPAAPPPQLSPADVAQPPKQPRSWRKILIRGGITTLVLLLVGAGTLLFSALSNRPQSSQVNSNVASTTIPLSEFANSGSLALLGAQSLTVNGQLRANESFILTPNTQPSTSEKGQIYYDKNTNLLAYYNGTQFIQLPGNANVVQTLQGQSGNVSLVGGAGIAVNGTTLVNTGVTSLGTATGDITLGNGLAITNGALANTGILSATSNTTAITVTNDGAGNITIGSNGAGSGTVQSPGGTATHLAVFTGVQTIADSIITDNGTIATINGNLTVTGSLSLSAPVSVANGGTGANTLTANGVLIGNGSGAVTAATAGSAGLCLVSTAGAPAFGSCTGGSTVSSLNGLSGALTLANASAAGSTITINDATTAAKGIASFNSTNFTVTSGAVNTIQNIDVAAAPTFGRLTLTSSQATSPMLLVNNTNGSGSGNLLDLQLSGSSKLAVSPAGAMTLTGTINGQTISSSANFTGTLGVAGLASLSGGATVTGTLTANTITPNAAMTVGSTGQSLTLQGNGSTTLTATSGGNTTALAFQAPTANVNYRLLTASAGTYDICTTAGNCTGVGGGVTTPGGTINKIPKFTGSQTLGDSIISDNGTTVTIGGVLAVNTITPSGALTVGATSQALTLQGTTTTVTATNGGTTNTLAFGTPSGGNKTITIPNATGTVVVSASSPLAIDAAGNITCPSCVTSAGVTSLNSLSGALTLANASGVGSTITINDATTAAKGIASFNSTNFTVTSGAVNTIQDIAVTSTPTFGRLTVTSSQATNGMLLVNNTNAGASGNLLDLQLNGSSKFAVTPAGALTLTGTVNGQTISSAANFTGTLGVTGLASLSGGATVTGTLTANTITPTGALTVGATNQSFVMQGNASSTVTATNGANTTTLAFQSPTANVTYRLLTATAGTYDICTTVGNCAGVGGGVTTPGGTTNQVAKFTSSGAIGDSIISDNGTTVTIGGTLAVNTITPASAMNIGATTQNLTLQGATTKLTSTSGGITNTLTFATPASTNKTITIPNATGTVAVSASGPLAIDAAGNITCPTCVTSGGGGGGVGAVDSVDGLTGALTIANSSGSGATITINDATTAAKGIASFNSTNFTVTSGAVNTVQDINTAATPTFGRLTVTSSQATNPMLLVNNTNAGASGNLLDVQLNGSSKLAITPAGAMTVAGTINGQTVSSSASFTGTLAVASTANLNGGATVTGTLTANTITPTGALTVGATGQSFLVQGSAASTITATNGGNTTTLAFQSPTAAVTYRFLTAATGTYDVCTTVGNCAGVGGGVTTPGGTTNKVAKFTASGVIGDSSITDNGTTVTIGGTLAVNTLTPTAALTVGATGQNLTLQGATTNLTSTSGGITNTLTFATPTGSNKTIIAPDASGTLVVSASGPLAIDAAGNITCSTCTTSSTAVTSLDGQTGALTLANSSGAGGTITIDDASTSVKGIATFNSTNFSASGGAVNTIQNINSTAAPTFGQLTLTSSQATAAMLTVNNTNAGASGNLIDLQLNGSSKFAVTPAGALTLASTINGQTISSSANFTGTLGVAGLASLSGGATVTGTLTANNLTPTGTLTVGATGQSFLLQGNASSTITATNSGNTSTLAFQTPTANVTYRLLTATAGTYDICTTVGNCTGGAITGSGSSGTIALFTGTSVIGNSIITQASTTVTVAGTLAANTAAQAPSLDSITGALAIGNNNATSITLGKTSSNIATTISGTAIVKPTSGNDSTTAFQVQNAANTDTVLDVNTTNQRVGVNTTAPGSTFQINQSNLTPGTVSNSSSSPNVTGTSTTFTSTFQPGDTFTITSSSNTCTVKQVTSDTTIVCTANLASSSSGSAYSFTQQVRLATSDNGTTTHSGPLVVTNPALPEMYTIKSDAATGNFKVSANSVGNASIGSTTDHGNNDIISASKYNSGSGGTINALRVYFSSVALPDGAKAAVYSDSSGTPGTLLSSASVGSTSIVGGGWITLPLGTNVTLTPNTVYWFGFDVNSASDFFGSTPSAANSSKYVALPFGTNFPASFSATASGTNAYSVYGVYTTVTDQSALGSALTIDNNNSITTKPLNNSLTAFQLQNASGTSLFSADTVNNRIYVGSQTVDTTGVLLVLDTKTSAGDPTEVDGAMYYNSNSGSFRCGLSGTWQNCIGGLLSSNTAVNSVIQNNSTETAFTQTYTVPANYCVNGRVLRVTANGVYGVTGAGPTLVLKMKLGSTVIATSETANWTQAESGTGWFMTGNMICPAATGASASVTGQGLVTYGNEANRQFPYNATTVATNASQVLSITVTWSVAAAANTINMQSLLVEGIGP